MTFNSGQRWRLEKLIGVIITETERGFGVNREQVINEIEEIVENPETVPACPMLQRQGIKLSACHGVVIGEEECKDCYSDLTVKPFKKVSTKRVDSK